MNYMNIALILITIANLGNGTLKSMMHVQDPRSGDKRTRSDSSIPDPETVSVEKKHRIDRSRADSDAEMPQASASSSSSSSSGSSSAAKSNEPPLSNSLKNLIKEYVPFNPWEYAEAFNKYKDGILHIEKVLENCKTIFQLDGKEIAVVNKAPIINIWNLDTRQCTAILKGNSKGRIDAVIKLKDGRIAASFNDGNGKAHIEIWNPTTQTCINTIPLTCENNDTISIAELADGRVASCIRGVIILWDPITCEETLYLYCHGATYRVQHLPNGQLAAYNNEGTIYLWDINDNDDDNYSGYIEGNNINTLMDPSIAQLKDGRIVSPANDRESNTIRIWDPVKRAYLQLQHDEEHAEAQDLIALSDTKIAFYDSTTIFILDIEENKTIAMWWHKGIKRLMLLDDYKLLAQGENGDVDIYHINPAYIKMVKDALELPSYEK